MKPALQTRWAAYCILQQIVVQQKTLDVAFESHLALKKMSACDYHFTHLLVLTTLRRFGQVKELLKPFLSKPLPTKRQDMELILILGIVQLYFLKTPAHAAVDTSVELVRLLKQSSFTRLINGVLRAFVRTGLTADEPPLTANLPIWLYQSWLQTYGIEKINAFCAAFVEEPALDISVKQDSEGWAQKLGGIVLPSETVRCSFEGAVTQLPGFKEGAWWVQEASASIPAQLFTQVKGLLVADLCAAPGGKTAQLAVRGARVIAYDISDYRLKRLKENMNRLGLAEKVVICCQDALIMTEVEKYDLVLLDAPCSATGTVKRHPDLFFHRTEADSQRLAALQKKLLANALQLVKKGGEVVYATCSLQAIENEEVVQAVLSDFPCVERVPLTDVRWQSFLNPQGAIQVTPDKGQDGFYAVLLRKKEKISD